MLDTTSGTNRVLDFVNIGGWGSSLDLTNTLEQLSNPGSPGFPPRSSSLVWRTSPATSVSNSPMSMGVSNQILIGEGVLAVSDLFPSNSANFNAFLHDDYFSPSLAIWTIAPFVQILQNPDLAARNPKVHFTLEDLSSSTTNIIDANPAFLLPVIRLGSLGTLNPSYTPATPKNLSVSLLPGVFQIGFKGVTDLPYLIWSSTDLTNWSLIGPATQPAPGVFQFADRIATNSTARFYQIRVP